MTETTEDRDRCPECERTDALVREPGSFPVCRFCDWTGWEKDAES